MFLFCFVLKGFNETFIETRLGSIVKADPIFAYFTKVIDTHLLGDKGDEGVILPVFNLLVLIFKSIFRFKDLLLFKHKDNPCANFSLCFPNINNCDSPMTAGRRQDSVARSRGHWFGQLF